MKGAGDLRVPIPQRRERPCPYCWPDGKCAENYEQSSSWRGRLLYTIEDWPEEAPTAVGHNEMEGHGDVNVQNLPFQAPE